MTLKLIAIGGLGSMLGPSAEHVSRQGVARYVRALDRGTRSARHDRFRDSWRQQGAQLVSNVSDLVGDGDFDGIVICAGKNGDDAQILRELIPRLKQRPSDQPYFILHLSTVSCAFVEAAYSFCQQHGIDYVNYPLTGGANRAADGSMLILASGNPSLYQRVLPMLEAMGQPKYFGTNPADSAAVKLIGHVLVFHGLLGISLAVGLQRVLFSADQSKSDPVAFFDVLNQGAGGTKQWDFPIRYALDQQAWGQGFLLHHAIIDALYTADLLRSKKLPKTLILPLLEIVLGFIYCLNQYPNETLATQVLARVLGTATDTQLDAFIQQHLTLDMDQCFANCVAALPPSLRASLLIDVVFAAGG